jgi:hypothetical protein
MYKTNYYKFSKLEKNLKKRKMISNEFDNIINSDVANSYAPMNVLKNIFTFDFNSDGLQELFQNNISYVDYQLKASNIYNKIIHFVKIKFL